jgi:putative tryptophan/tyrosine transport system substrate-binding protein
MDRRAFTAVAAGILSWSLGFSRAQQPNRIYRIGVLLTNPIDTPSQNPWWKAFIQRLRELGWIENENFVTRFSETKGENAVTSAKALVDEPVDLIVAGSTEAAIAASQASRRVPIVGTALGDPVGTGLASSLARPGGNVTGTSFQGTEVTAKQMELIRDMVPGVSKVAVLVNPANASHRPRIQEAMLAADRLKLQLDVIEAHHANELRPAFDAIARNRDGAVLVLADPLFRVEASRVADLAQRSKVPAMFGLKEDVIDGGLMSYGASFTALFRQTADYVDKILRGAKPADLPIEQPTKFELVINLKTAKALGVIIPQALLLRADDLIQ